MPPPKRCSRISRSSSIVDAGAFAVYAQRDQTRRTHLAELTRRLRSCSLLTVRLFTPWSIGHCQSYHSNAQPGGNGDFAGAGITSPTHSIAVDRGTGAYRTHGATPG